MAFSKVWSVANQAKQSPNTVFSFCRNNIHFRMCAFVFVSKATHSIKGTHKAGRDIKSEKVPLASAEQLYLVNIRLKGEKKTTLNTILYDFISDGGEQSGACRGGDTLPTGCCSNSSLCHNLYEEAAKFKKKSWDIFRCCWFIVLLAFGSKISSDFFSL